MSADRDRILELLRERGEQGLSSYEIRTMGLSGNPSERYRELVAAGHEIHAEATHRVDAHGKKRPMTIYRLAGGDGRRVGKNTTRVVCTSPAVISGQRPDGDTVSPRGASPGGVDMASSGPPRLFEVDDTPGYYDQEAA